MSEGESSSRGVIGKLTQLFALYLIYVFLSGWTFFDYYFREFGVDPRWLDLPSQEVLVKGFTILFTGGYWLWAIYIVMIIGPIAVDELPTLHRHVPVRITVASILFSVLVCLYFASRSAGIAAATIDKGPSTRLPLIIFTRKSISSASPADSSTRDFTGHVLAFRNGIYYLHKVSTVGSQSHETIALSVFRIEDLTDVQIVEH